MQDTRRSKLYFLQGSTIIVGAAIVSNRSEEVISDTTRLWQMRLGHAGERTLQGLVKQGLLKGGKA